MKSFNVRQFIGAKLVRAGMRIAPDPGAITLKHGLILGPNPFAVQVLRDMPVFEEKNGILVIKDGEPVQARNEDGSFVFEKKIIQEAAGCNEITVVGKNHLLDVTFGAAVPIPQVDPWYIGLIDQSPTPTTSENDTLAAHAGWSEANIYSGNRKAWDDTDSSNKVKGTNSVSTFVINDTGEIHGIFIASVDTGTSGILWATGSFDSSLSVVNTDELKITYGIRT